MRRGSTRTLPLLRTEGERGVGRREPRRARTDGADREAGYGDASLRRSGGRRRRLARSESEPPRAGSNAASISARGARRGPAARTSSRNPPARSTPSGAAATSEGKSARSSACAAARSGAETWSRPSTRRPDERPARVGARRIPAARRSPGESGRNVAERSSVVVPRDSRRAVATASAVPARESVSSASIESGNGSPRPCRTVATPSSSLPAMSPACPRRLVGDRGEESVGETLGPDGPVSVAGGEVDSPLSLDVPARLAGRRAPPRRGSSLPSGSPSRRRSRGRRRGSSRPSRRRRACPRARSGSRRRPPRAGASP